LAEIYETEQFKNEWANNVRFHVARNILQLRRYRKESQSSVAGKMGTSQSAIARMETGQENITLDTLERLTDSLRGRFYVSIYPQECPFRPIMPWWEWLAFPGGKYFMAHDQEAGQVFMAWQFSMNNSFASTSGVTYPLLVSGSTT